MPFDKDYWAIVTVCGAICISETRSEAIKKMVGPEVGYAKRWRKIKRWETRPRVVRIIVTWEEPKPRKRQTTKG
jgi:hypothetical protein